jgi:heat shock protein HslJ
VSAALRSIGVVTALVLAAGCGSGRAALESKTLVPQNPGDLNGTEWYLVGTGIFHAAAPATPMTLRFEERTASGNGPCNIFHLPFTHTGDKVTTGTLASTKRACAPALMAAEHYLFNALEAVDTAEKESGQLVLTGPGDVRLVFAPAHDTADQLAGTWDIVSYATATAVTTPIVGTKPTVAFDANGTLAIDTGCNLGHSTWIAVSSTVEIAVPATTNKLCISPTGIMEQEASIFAALPRAHRVEISHLPLSHDAAVLLDAAGLTVLVLDRHD